MSEKHGLGVRGDSLYCPLPLFIESYWWCEPNCPHCHFRRLNHVWGEDLRPVNPEALKRKLENGLENRNPRTTLAHCLSRKRTIRVGNKADPFQPAERQYKASTGSLRVLTHLRWSFVIQTRFTGILEEVADREVQRAHKHGLVTMLPIISPGLERDWEVFEQEKTTPVEERLRTIARWTRDGIPVGVGGEPFIPGFHTTEDFENAVKAIKAAGVRRYNTYNFHFTAHVAKRIHGLPGVDIEKIWWENQDAQWKKTLPKLLRIAEKHDIILGCPDFVNTGPDWWERANTCCGIDIPSPTTFNTHYFKKLAQEGKTAEEIEALTWDGSGDPEQGGAIIRGKRTKFYTLKDAKVI